MSAWYTDWAPSANTSRGPARTSDGRQGCDGAQFAEPALAQAGLVEPALGLFGEQADDADAVEVDELVPGAVDPAGHVAHAVPVEVVQGFVENRLAVGEFE